MTTVSDGYYTDQQWSILESLGLTGLVAEDMVAGPTLSQHGGDGDFQARAEGQVLVETKWHYAAAGFYDKMKIVSDGLLVINTNHLYIDAQNSPLYNEVHYQ